MNFSFLERIHEIETLTFASSGPSPILFDQNSLLFPFHYFFFFPNEEGNK